MAITLEDILGPNWLLVACSKCSGSGGRRDPEINVTFSMYTPKIKCRECSGKGKVYQAHKWCGEPI